MLVVDKSTKETKIISSIYSIVNVLVYNLIISSYNDTQLEHQPQNKMINCNKRGHIKDQSYIE